jgi:hypothetical protein
VLCVYECISCYLYLYHIHSSILEFTYIYIYIHTVIIFLLSFFHILKISEAHTALYFPHSTTCSISDFVMCTMNIFSASDKCNSSNISEDRVFFFVYIFHFLLAFFHCTGGYFVIILNSLTLYIS